jgi:hypothetical protein
MARVSDDGRARVTLGGDTFAVTTLAADDVRPVDRNEIAHARPVAAN